MPDSSLIYYVSGHGYGHARRSANIIRAFAMKRPDVRVHVRSTAPGWIFDGLGERVEFHDVGIDRGAIEDDPLTINWPATLENLAGSMAGEPELVEREVRFLRERRAQLIVADIPFLAGYVAEAAGIPCVGVGNFTWDWIYEPYLLGNPVYRDFLERIRGGYARMQCLLRLPFPQPANPFSQTIDVPFVAFSQRRERDEVLRAMGIEAGDDRKRILIGMRGGISPQSLRRAGERCREMLFLCPTLSDGQMPENVRRIDNTPDLSFWDATCVCDAVVSKLGHGIVTDCIAAGAGLLYPERIGFREDALLAEGAGTHIRMRRIPAREFLEGEWADDLRELLSMPGLGACGDTDGGEVCADILSKWI